VSYEKQDHHGPAFLFSIVLMPDISVNNLPSKNSRYCKLIIGQTPAGLFGKMI
jgi:hypothetical protein